MNTCHLFAKVLNPPYSGVWRQRFRALYDHPLDKTSDEIKIEYEIRSIVLRQNISFEYGEGPKQGLWLDVLKTMLIGMYDDIKYFDYQYPSQPAIAGKKIASQHHNMSFFSPYLKRI